MYLLSVIVFSKDRPLQLHGYLESLIFYSKIKEEAINVIFKETPDIPYEIVINSFKSINWIKQTDFFQNLTCAINDSKEYIMFGCDDVVFSSNFNIQGAISTLKEDEDIFGFSLRLGKNIRPKPNNYLKKEKTLVWNWTKTNCAHWNYPWELDGTIYRKSDIQAIIEAMNSDTLKNPNYLEAVIANDPCRFIRREKLASFRKSKCLVITVNRVQDNFPNDFDERKNYTPKNLQFLYEKDRRIYYRYFKQNRIIHVDSSYLILIPKWMFCFAPIINAFLFIRNMWTRFCSIPSKIRYHIEKRKY